MKSAIDQDDLYELTGLGQQFIHYAMTDLPLRIEMGLKRKAKIPKKVFSAHPTRNAGPHRTVHQRTQ